MRKNGTKNQFLLLSYTSVDTERSKPSKLNLEAYLCLLLLGIGSLLPYNFFITPELFWQEKLSTPNETVEMELNWMQNFWQNFLALGENEFQQF